MGYLKILSVLFADSLSPGTWYRQRRRLYVHDLFHT